MNTNNHNSNQLCTILFGMACVIAGVVCFANGLLHHAAPTAVQKGERQGISPPSAISHRDLSAPMFTSLSPRYVTKPIAEIKAGEEVVTRDTTTGETTTRKVLNAFRRVSTHLRILRVFDPLTQETQTIETTDEHPFWVSQRGDWIKAKDLSPGDQFDDARGGHAVLVASEYESHPEGIAVYNFEVEDFHNYYVKAHGSRGPPVLAHNAECNEWRIASDSTVAPNSTAAPIAHGTPYRQLSRTRIQKLEAKVADRTITQAEWKHLQWQKRLTQRRQDGIDAFWAQERQFLSQGLPGTRHWNGAAREAILAGGQPRGIFSHHKYSVSQYPQLANDPTNIFPVTFFEHFQRWHGRNWRNATHGIPLRPDLPAGF